VPVLLGGLVTDLPRAVHLVAEAPQPDSVWVRSTVPPAQVGPFGSPPDVAVLHEISGGVDAPGAEVDGHHRLAADVSAPGNELVDSHPVGLDGAPGQIQPRGPFFNRADAVLPVLMCHLLSEGPVFCWDRRSRGLARSGR
jgi:hypothetical protein